MKAEIEAAIAALAKKAVDESKASPAGAMQLSQAVLNLAHALVTLLAQAKGRSLDCQIRHLPLCIRTQRALEREGIMTLAQLAAMPNSELSKLPDIGSRTLQEINCLLWSVNPDLVDQGLCAPLALRRELCSDSSVGLTNRRLRVHLAM